MPSEKVMVVLFLMAETFMFQICFSKLLSYHDEQFAIILLKSAA